MGGPVDLTGKSFGYLTVLSYAGQILEGGKGRKRRTWTCECKCGRITVVTTGNLRPGGTTSCGCTKTGNPTHNMSRTPEYKCWKGMRKRCNNPNDHLYEYYGARGIKVCERWDSFENFLADMGPMPQPHYTVERENVDGDYEPGNCVWLPKSRQNWNRRDSIRVTLNGVTKSLPEWAHDLKIPYRTLLTRYLRNWTPERMLTTPRDPSQPLTKPDTVNLTYNGKTQSLRKWAEELNLSYPTCMSRYKKGYPPELIFFPTKLTNQQKLNHLAQRPT